MSNTHAHKIEPKKCNITLVVWFFLTSFQHIFSSSSYFNLWIQFNLCPLDFFIRYFYKWKSHELTCIFVNQNFKSAMEREKKIKSERKREVVKKKHIKWELFSFLLQVFTQCHKRYYFDVAHDWRVVMNFQVIFEYINIITAQKKWFPPNWS